MRIKRKKKGMIALVTVIVISGILLVTGIALVLASADLAMSAKGYAAKVNLQSTMRTCLEESIYKLKFDDTFTGQISHSGSSGSCTADVSDDINPGIKNIDVTTLYGDYTNGKLFQVDVSQEPYQLLD